MRHLLIFLAGATLAATANANLLTNGSFEDGRFDPNGDNTESLAIGSTAMTGWTVEDDSIAWIQDPNPFNGVVASDGKRSLDLTGYGDASPYGGVQQTFATVVGASYVVSFDFGQNGSYGPADIYASVNNGALNEFTLDNNPGQNWKTKSFSFVGFDTSATLNISGAPNSGSTNYIGLDNVQVNGVVPEPVSFLPLGLGALVLLNRRRK